MHTPPPYGSIGQNSTFSEHGHFEYQVKGNHQMKQHGSKYFAHRPLLDPSTLMFGSIGQNTYFQNMSCYISTLRESRMQHHGSKNFAHRPPYPHAPSTHPGDGVNRSKFIFFQDMVMLHIKLKGITKCNSMVANIFPVDSLTQRSKLNFFRIWSCCISYERELQMQQHGTTYPPPPPPDPGDWAKRSK